jgi:hypothetical protein
MPPKLRCANPVFGCKTPQNVDLCPPTVLVRLLITELLSPDIHLGEFYSLILHLEQSL